MIDRWIDKDTEGQTQRNTLNMRGSDLVNLVEFRQVT